MSLKTMRWIAVLIFVGVVVMALRLIGPAVPNEIRLLAGPEGTTFHEDGLRYQEILGRHGVDVELVETRGSVENLSTLVEAEVPTAAFVWGLRDEEGQEREVPEGIESLGTMYLQPLWVFASKGTGIERLRDFEGLRVEAGQQGSDSRQLALFLLTEEGIGAGVNFGENHPATPEEVKDAVLEDRFAAIVAVGEPDSQLIDILLRSPKLQTISIQRADAFAIQHSFLQPVRFPEGGHDLRANIPDHDLDLLAARVQLVVSDLFPPAIADLLLQAAMEIHGEATPFSSRGEFPSADSAPLPLNRAADNFYTKGPPKLMKYLPFRPAAWINRFMAAAVAIASAAVTVFRILPALISLPFRLRIRRGFGELQALERSAAAGTDKKTLLGELAKVDRFTASIKVPIRRLEPQWIELRQFLHDMRDRLESMQP
ncbi:MAG: hypothetical protein GWP16_02150 [Nitrospirae bacterium]|nr:hypothetical protein [Nitrospirota bacterium]